MLGRSPGCCLMEPCSWPLLAGAPGSCGPAAGERRVGNYISSGKCNTPGVCHQLSNGFKLKHGMLSGDEGVKIKSTRASSNSNLDKTHLYLHVYPC